MRYGLTSLMIPACLLACGLVIGCTKETKTDNADSAKQAKAIEDAAKELAKQAAAREKANKEAARTETPVNPKVVVNEPAPKDITSAPPAPPVVAEKTVQVAPPVETPAKEFEPPVFQETKKDKDSTKEKTKDKDKDKDKEPKLVEPTEVMGKTFQEWMKEMKDTDPAKREAAIKAVTMFGPAKAYQALPEIIVQMNRHNPNAPTGETIDLAMRVNGIMAMSTILKMTWSTKKEGPDPKLLDQCYAIYKKAMKDPQVIMRMRAVQGIIFVGPKSREAIDDVVTLARDPVTWEVRKEALQALVFMGGPDGKGAGPNEKSLKALRSALGSPIGNRDVSYFVRQTAIQGLTMLSHGTGKVPAELWNKGVTDPAVEVRLSALNGIAELEKEFDDADRKAAIKKLNERVQGVKVLETDDVIFMWIHATVMTLQKGADKTHVNPIIDKLNNSKDVPAKLQALNILGLGGDKTKPHALKAVQAYVDDKEPSVAFAAIITCMKFGDFEPVLGKLKHKEPEFRLQALDLIGKAGEAAKPACADAIVKTIGDPEVTIGAAAIDTLVNIHCFEAMPTLRKIAVDKMAPEALRQAAKDALEDFEDLIKAKSLKDKKDKTK